MNGRLTSRSSQRGSAMIEFAIVGPVLMLIGLAILQYGMLFFAKNQMNHAGFMAARAGSMGHASKDTVRAAYIRALVPLYGGGRTSVELAESYAKASADVVASAYVELLNPTTESFDDWNDADLQNEYGARAIPNGGLAFKNPGEIRPKSGQNIQDANIIKVKITHGYAPKVPLMGLIYTKYLQWLDPKTNARHTQLVDAGRIPVVTSVTLQMQSDAIESGNVSTPDPGNGGNPTDPGDPPTGSGDPPACWTIGCTVPPTPVDPGGGGGGGGPVCP